MLGRSSPTARQFGHTDSGDRSASDGNTVPQFMQRTSPSRPCMWITFFEPAISCSGSMFWVTIVTSPPYFASRRASASWAALGAMLGGAEQAARLVVEIEHLLLVAMPGLDRGDVLQVDPGPQPVRVAEGVDAAFLGDARAGQHHDAGREEILMHVATI